jgi:hypothetical protein
LYDLIFLFVGSGGLPCYFSSYSTSHARRDDGLSGTRNRAVLPVMTLNQRLAFVIRILHAGKRNWPSTCSSTAYDRNLSQVVAHRGRPSPDEPLNGKAHLNDIAASRAQRPLGVGSPVLQPRPKRLYASQIGPRLEFSE